MYEPNVRQGALINTALALNKNYMKIVDIQETQDVEFCVNYAQPFVWLKTVAPGQSILMHGTSLDYTGLGIVNGFISVTPFTALQSPDDSGVYINVYVSGEDMQFNLMTSVNMPVQRMVVTESSDDGISPPVDYTCFDLNPTSENALTTSEYCFGEQPLSFRSTIKRYVTTSTNVDTFNSTAHDTVTYVRNIILPASPSYGASGITNYPFHITYLPYAFLGVRGGVRKRLRFYKVGEDYSVGMSSIAMLNEPEASLTTSGPTKSVGSYHMKMIGAAQFMPRTNGGVEIELPYYSPNLFSFSFANDFIGDQTLGQMSTTWVKNFSYITDTNLVSVTAHLGVETAAAEDFTFMRFMGAPYYTFGL